MNFYRQVLNMAAEWTNENTWIITKLFATQARAENRPNTHLTPMHSRRWESNSQ